VLFSEPKIPQFSVVVLRFVVSAVSVLFSEPKIPQLPKRRSIFQAEESFSALQRAENSSIGDPVAPYDVLRSFQCSSASRKFLNSV